MPNASHRVPLLLQSLPSPANLQRLPGERFLYSLKEDDAEDGRARAGGSTIKTRAGWVPKIPPSRSRDAAVAPETSLFLFPDEIDYLREEAQCQYKTENENRFHVGVLRNKRKTGRPRAAGRPV